MTTYTPARTSFPAPPMRYDRQNEAQFRTQLERSVSELVAYVERLIGDGETVTPHVLATETGLGVNHTMSGASAGDTLRATGATTAVWAQLNFSDLAGSIADGQVPESAVTQHQAALSIAETQIPDGSILARVAGSETITGLYTFSNASGLLTNVIGERTAAAGVTVDGLLIKDAGIPEAAVTAHQAALSIAETQIPDGALLARLADNETVSGSWLFSSNTAFGSNVFVGTGTPLNRILHVRNDDIGLTLNHLGEATETVGAVFVGESQDAQVVLASNNEGSHGSALDLLEVQAGTLIDRWTIVRRTSDAFGDPSALRFYYGSNDYFPNNDPRLTLTKNGHLRIAADSVTSLLSLSRSDLTADTSRWDFRINASGGLELYTVQDDGTTIAHVFTVAHADGDTTFTDGQVVIGSDPGGSANLRVANSLRTGTPTIPALLEGNTILSGFAGLWLRKPSPSNLNYSVLGDTTSTYINAATGGTLFFRVNNSTRAQINNTDILLQVPVTITGDFLPNADSTYDIGSTSVRFANGYFDAIDTAAINEAAVTAHEAALSIAETQITDGSILARLAANETVTGLYTFQGGRIDTPFEDNASNGTLNDYDPGNNRAILLFTSASAKTLTGVVAGSDGQRLIIGSGGGALQINHADAGSTAANRFFTKSGANLTGVTMASFVYLTIAGIAGWYET